MKKNYILITILLLFFLTYLTILFLPRNYTITYQLDDYQITEHFNRELSYYTFLIEYEERIFPLIYTGRLRGRRLINRIEKINDDYTICLSIYVNDRLHPVCYMNDELVSFHVTTDNIKDYYRDIIPNFSNIVIDTFSTIRIFNYLDNAFFIWNYRGYYFLSEGNNRNITLLETDNYNNALALKADDFLITPNYDRSHSFNELFIINARNLELSSFEFEEEIHYNSYFQGTIGRYTYLVDRRNRLQYRINIRRRSIELIGSENRLGRWYNNGWEEVSLIRLANEEHFFIKNQVHNFSLINNRLYHLIGDYQKRVSNQNVTAIIYTSNDRIFYLVDNILHMFSKATGEVKLIENSEWFFNFQNQIFIFN